jgi:hypothetical protein
VLEVTAPVGVLAVNDLRLVWVEFQTDFGHPLMQRGQHLVGLLLTAASDDHEGVTFSDDAKSRRVHIRAG